MGKSKEISAGLLMWDIIDGVPKIFLAKPGGPYFWKKHERCFGIPKGHIEENENLLQCAIREFQEETGITPKGPYVEIPSSIYKSGKIVHAWMFRGTFNGNFKSNSFKMEFPPKSGQFKEFPELDKPTMADIESAKKLVMISQDCFVESAEKYFKENGLI